MNRATVFAAMLWYATAGSVLGSTRHVPADYDTIQAAIDASTTGDVVLVAPGLYTGEGNRDIDFRGKGIELRSEQGPETCVIDCGGPYPAYAHWLGRRNGSRPRGSGPEPYDYYRAFHFDSHQAANSLVQGFTVTGAAGVNSFGVLDDGGAFYCYKSCLAIRDCIIVSNAASRGAGIYAFDSQIDIDDCIIAENTAYGDRLNGSTGAGVCAARGGVCLSNCRITGNVASRAGAGISCSGDNWIVNCVVAGNRTYSYGGGISFTGSAGDTSHVLNSIIWGNMRYDTTSGFTGSDITMGGGGVGGDMSVEAIYSLIGADSNSVEDYSYNDMVGQWFHGDPLFAASGYWDPNGTPDDPYDDFWVEGDYHLKSRGGRWDALARDWAVDDVTSPYIDAGDPNSPIGLEPFPNGGYVNLGAYGGSAEASKSYFGEPPCETIVAGDINGDCRVDLVDLLILISHWTDSEPPDLGGGQTCGGGLSAPLLSRP